MSQSCEKSKDIIRFGISIPENIKKTPALDACNKNNLQQKAIEKELDKVRVEFSILGDEEQAPIGSNKINYHLIFA